MTAHGYLQCALYLGVLFALIKPLGGYMARIYDGQPTGLSRIGAPVERLIYRVCGVRSDDEMDWKRYAVAMLIFSVLGVLVVYGLQRLQVLLPLNPQHFGAVSPDSSFNTALSFVTNTNWQGYSGESTMSDLTQMLGLAVQNFFSAATGMVIAVALIRGFARRSSQTIGNFWVDLTRTTLYILLPLSIVMAVVLIQQGTVQSFSAYQTVSLTQPFSYDQPKVDDSGNPVKNAKGSPVTESVTVKEQLLPLGPLASQAAIKQLGTNGGGFFNANSAHPFENPTPLTNFIEMLAIFLIPGGLVYMFGKMVGDTRQGWAILGAMTLIFVVMAGVAIYAEQQGNPLFTALGVDQGVGAGSPGGNMEGKETRFGIVNSALFATITTSASCGAVNAMHDSLTPIGGLVPMWLIQLGEVVFGGVGSGLYGMLMYALVAVFVAGLMIGRTPEYIGKKIEAFDMKMVAIAILVTPFIVLTGTAIAVLMDAGTAGIANPGAHGFSEILYAFSSAANNNGSAFAGLSANTPFYNIALGVAVWFGRFWPAVAVLAVAGSLAAKKRIAPGLGTLPTHTPLFIALLIGVVLLVGALTYVPALALGPGIEQLLMTGAH